MSLNHLDRASLTDAALGELRAAIEAGEWRVGERIPVESALCERLGVSRNTVREAVRVLVHAGVLDTRQGAGTFVRAAIDPGQTIKRIDQSTLGERLEVRLTLEADAARLAAARRTASDLDALNATLAAREHRRAERQQKQKTHALAALIEADAAFHRAVVAAAHNAALSELYDYFAFATRDVIRQTEIDARLPTPSQDDHAAIVRAINAGAGEDAAAAARRALAGAVAALANAPSKP